MSVLLKLAVVGSVVLFGLSIYPGVLFDLLFVVAIFSPFWFPALIIGGFFLVSILGRSARKPRIGAALDLAADDIGASKATVHQRRWLILAPVIVAMSLILIWYDIPRRIAFVLSRPAFERRVATAPNSVHEGEPPGRRLGLYFVDRYVADPRGGVYFRTHAGPDGIGPDTMSYGFAFRPNREGSPFGRAGYHLSRMVGDWYGFSASNDY